MKECNKVFFGEKGLTQTSANHLANIAKETVESNRQALDSVGFVNVNISLLSGGNSRTVKTGRNEAYLDNVPTLLQEVANMNAFCAWIREAIKAREEELEIINRYTWDLYATDVAGFKLDTPIKGHILTEEEAIASLSIAERMEYYRLEAEASAIGKYIHPMRPFANARRALMDAYTNPTKVEGSGTDTIVYSYDPSVSSDKVENTFFALQQKHRDISARLNKIKFKIDKMVKDSEYEVNQAYKQAVDRFNLDAKTLFQQCETWKVEERKKLLELKIVIPNELQATYELLTKISNPDK